MTALSRKSLLTFLLKEDVERVNSLNIPYLYHFTTLQKAVKILKSGNILNSTTFTNFDREFNREAGKAPETPYISLTGLSKFNEGYPKRQNENALWDEKVSGRNPNLTKGTGLEYACIIRFRFSTKTVLNQGEVFHRDGEADEYRLYARELPLDLSDICFYPLEEFFSDNSSKSRPFYKGRYTLNWRCAGILLSNILGQVRVVDADIKDGTNLFSEKLSRVKENASSECRTVEDVDSYVDFPTIHPEFACSILFEKQFLDTGGFNEEKIVKWLESVPGIQTENRRAIEECIDGYFEKYYPGSHLELAKMCYGSLHSWLKDLKEDNSLHQRILDYIGGQERFKESIANRYNLTKTGFKNWKDSINASITSARKYNDSHPFKPASSESPKKIEKRQNQIDKKSNFGNKEDRQKWAEEKKKEIWYDFFKTNKLSKYFSVDMQVWFRYEGFQFNAKVKTVDDMHNRLVVKVTTPKTGNDVLDKIYKGKSFTFEGAEIGKSLHVINISDSKYQQFLKDRKEFLDKKIPGRDQRVNTHKDDFILERKSSLKKGVKFYNKKGKKDKNLSPEDFNY